MESQAQIRDLQPVDYVYDFAASATFGRSAKAVCFSARASGLYYSINEGVSWQSAYGSLNLHVPLPTMAVAIPQNFEQDPSVFVGLNGGILCSFNGGRNWESIPLPPPPPTISSLNISPNFSQDGLIFAGTMEDGVLCSSDFGRHWVAWNFGLLDLNILCMTVSPNFADDKTLFVGTQSGVFQSNNGGRSWREVNLPIGFETVLSLALSPDFTRDGTIYAGTETQGLLCSMDGGERWKQLGENIFMGPVNSVLLSPEFPKQSDIMVLNGGELLISIDGGKSWRSWRNDLLEEKDVIAILAPLGFRSGVTVLLGLMNGDILRIK